MSSSFAPDRVFSPAFAPFGELSNYALFFEELFFDLIPSPLLLMGAATRLCILLRRLAHAQWGLL